MTRLLSTTAERDAGAGIDASTRDRLLGLLGVVSFPLAMWFGGIDIPIPIGAYAIPLSLQSLFVVLAAMSLGPRLGAASMGLYLLMGAVGLPVFSEGRAGLEAILGRTGGYLLGFVLCAPIVNFFVRRKDRTIRAWWWILIGSFVGHLAIFAVGVPWLYVVMSRDPVQGDSVTVASVVQNGFVIFIPGMVIKCLIAAIVGFWAAPHASKRGW